MRRCFIEVNPFYSLGIGFQVSGARCQQTPNPETRNLNTDLVAAEGLRWGNDSIFGEGVDPGSCRNRGSKR